MYNPEILGTVPTAGKERFLGIVSISDEFKTRKEFQHRFDWKGTKVCVERFLAIS